jgi:exopolysaccharide biosynthesis polyprenyl glycosylphosphotransferase
VIGRRSQFYFGLTVALDILLSVAAWNLTYMVRFHWGPACLPGTPWLFDMVENIPAPYRIFAALIPVVVAANLLALGIVGSYDRVRSRSILREWMRVCRAAVFAWIVMLAIFYCLRQSRFSLRMLLLFLPVNCGGLMLSRYMLLHLLRRLRRNAKGIERVAIIGIGRLAQETLHRLRENPWLSSDVVCFIDATGAGGGKDEIHGIPVLEINGDVYERMKEQTLDSVFFAMPGGDDNTRDKVLDAVLRLPVSVVIVPEIRSVFRMPSRMGDLEGIPVIQISGTPVHGWSAVAKRILDIFGAGLFLLVFGWWIMSLLAILVKLTSRGPILYRQERMGLGGKRYQMLKFRSMYVDAESSSGPVWAVADDPRCTPLGGFMRRTSLDELPQFLNVLKGDMSLVGPRPERPHFVEQFTEELPSYMMRHNVKAGITGWAQVNGLRGNTSLKKRLQYDLYYLNNWSLAFDFFILAMTPFSGFINKNAY